MVAPVEVSVPSTVVLFSAVAPVTVSELLIDVAPSRVEAPVTLSVPLMV